jgi:hypothetical protein
VPARCVKPSGRSLEPRSDARPRGMTVPREQSRGQNSAYRSGCHKVLFSITYGRQNPVVTPVGRSRPNPQTLPNGLPVGYETPFQPRSVGERGQSFPQSSSAMGKAAVGCSDRGAMRPSRLCSYPNIRSEGAPPPRLRASVSGPGATKQLDRRSIGYGCDAGVTQSLPMLTKLRSLIVFAASDSRTYVSATPPGELRLTGPAATNFYFQSLPKAIKPVVSRCDGLARAAATGMRKLESTSVCFGGNNPLNRFAATRGRNECPTSPGSLVCPARRARRRNLGETPRVAHPSRLRQR